MTIPYGSWQSILFSMRNCLNTTTCSIDGFVHKYLVGFMPLCSSALSLQERCLRRNWLLLVALFFAGHTSLLCLLRSFWLGFGFKFHLTRLSS